MFALRQITKRYVQRSGGVFPTSSLLYMSGINCRNFSIKYSKSHEYAHLDGDITTVGITDYATTQLGDVVYVELPSIGKMVAAGDVFGSVESVKAATDVHIPVSGEIIEINNVSIRSFL